jgi:hypothetical protein
MQIMMGTGREERSHRNVQIREVPDGREKMTEKGDVCHPTIKACVLRKKNEHANS